MQYSESLSIVNVKIAVNLLKSEKELTTKEKDLLLRGLYLQSALSEHLL